MSEIKELTEIEKAAGHYVYQFGAKNMLLRINAFEAGAKWQKERDKGIREALQAFVDWHEKHNAISFIEQEIIDNAKKLL